MSLLVDEPGHGSLVQDRGRPGLGHLGVGVSGAFDRTALRQANALLGNEVGAAAIETYGGLRLLAQHDHVIAVTGAVGRISIDDRPVAYGRPIPVASGQRLAVGPPMIGLYTYVGLSGGIAAAPELGSASRDTLSGLGPPPLRTGDVLVTNAGRRSPILDDVPPLVRTGELTLDVVIGPRDDWFTPPSVRRLLEQPWRVSSSSSRVGVRLDGESLERLMTQELPSEPVVRGSIQVTAGGQPVIFGPDHPVTGGYPVIAVVTDAHTDLLAQARPGQTVRFRRISNGPGTARPLRRAAGPVPASHASRS